MARMDGKIALVTGSAQGLGAAISRAFVREGAKVAVTDLNGEGAVATAAALNGEVPGSALALSHDVTSPDQWQDVLAKAEAHFGGLNVLVNNAGIGCSRTVEEATIEEWRECHAIDLDSVFYGCKYALPVMRKYAPGAIVNISSIAGLIAGHNMAPYNSAKAGVWMLSKSVALHCARRGYGIRCNSVHPTFIKTPILDPLVEALGEEQAFAKLARQVPLGTLGEPEDMANTMLFLASNESKFITGAELKVDGGISAM